MCCDINGYNILTSCDVLNIMTYLCVVVLIVMTY